MRNFLFTSLALALLCATPAMARDAASLKTNLSETWQGDFLWKDAPGQAVQKVTIHFHNIVDGAVGKIWAFGDGKYDVGGSITGIDVKCLIDPESLHLELWETTASDKGDFETNGSHVGAFSPDLKTIKAIWTTKGTGQQGELVLETQ